MKTLISMTDFVLERQGKILNSELGILTYNYANFLKQPLKLEMFIPCDEDGNVLEEYKRKPSEVEADLYNYPRPVSIEEHIWNKAKEKVLFEGFKPYEDYECAKYEEVYVDEEVCDGKFTVEDLIKDAGKTKIKLSQTALNAIFG